MNSKILTFATGALLMTGCVSYTGIATDEDEKVDAGNQAYAAAAAKSYAARKNAKARPAIVKEAPGVNLFLESKAFSSHPVCQNLALRKELLLAFKSQLREKVNTLKDFKLLEENAPATSVVAEGEEAVPQNYVFTYNISSIEIKQDSSGTLATGLAGAALGGSVGKTVADQKFWDGIAKVEVRLMDPTGTKCIFSYTGDGVVNKMVAADQPIDKSILLEAVKIAADNAIAGYITQFGPPIYVTDTCQGGQFVRLSVGSEYGIQPEQNIEFYQNKVRTSATGEEEVSRKVVGQGVVGVDKAPVEADGAWVRVSDFDSANRTVFRFTSARVLPSAKK